MANIIKFPIKSVRDWALVERAFREVLTKANTPQKMTEEMCSRMKKHWDKYSNVQLAFKIQIPDGVDPGISEAIDEAIRQGVQGVAEQIHNLMNEVIFIDLLEKEVELYSLTKGHPGAG